MAQKPSVIFLHVGLNMITVTKVTEGSQNGGKGLVLQGTVHSRHEPMALGGKEADCHLPVFIGGNGKLGFIAVMARDRGGKKGKDFGVGKPRLYKGVAHAFLLEGLFSFVGYGRIGTAATGRGIAKGLGKAIR